MLKTNWPIFVCTFAVIATLIGCTWWLATELVSIDQDVDGVAVDIEHINR